MPLRLDVNVTVKLDAVHVHFHGEDTAQVLGAISNLKRDFKTMNANLQAALAELVASTAANASKVDSLTDIVKSIPGLIGAAVTSALAAADVDADAAAAIIHDAGRTAGDHVQALLDAAETATGQDIDGDGDIGNATPPAGGGDDTIPPGAGDDTVPAGGGGDDVPPGGDEPPVGGDETTSG